MARALFHKNQRVFVKPVGTWAVVERVIPHWVKDVEEPLRITYDLGLGREFTAGEMVSEAVMGGRDRQGDDQVEIEDWRVFRIRNKWAETEVTAKHPIPGTFPVVVTDERDWGGWRVPGAEYDRDPARIEHQARVISNGPQMLRLTRELAEFAAQNTENCPADLMQLAKRAVAVLADVYETQSVDLKEKA